MFEMLSFLNRIEKGYDCFYEKNIYIYFLHGQNSTF